MPHRESILKMVAMRYSLLQKLKQLHAVIPFYALFCYIGISSYTLVIFLNCIIVTKGYDTVFGMPLLHAKGVSILP